MDRPSVNGKPTMISSISQSGAEFLRWGKANAPFLTLIFGIAAAAIGASLKIGYVISKLQSDLQKERELRESDVKLRGFEISKAYSDGRAFALEQVLSEKKPHCRISFRGRIQKQPRSQEGSYLT